MDRASQISLWRLRRAARGLDRIAMTTIALSILALGLYALAVRPLESQAQSLRDQVARLESHAANQRASAEPQRPASQLAVFYEQLPAVAQAPEVVRVLHEHAQNAGLIFERGEYRPLPDVSSKLVRYQIAMPVRGSYPQVRHFLATATRDMPGLALDGIGFKRGQGATDQLEVQLQFTAFLRMAS